MVQVSRKYKWRLLSHISTIVDNRIQFLHLSLLLISTRLIAQLHSRLLIGIYMQGSQLCFVVYVELFGWGSAYQYTIVLLSCVFKDVVDLETCSLIIRFILLSYSTLENNFLSLFLTLIGISSRHASGAQFGQSHIFLFISEVRHIPLLLLFIPLGIIDNILYLVVTHKNVKNGTEFFNLLLLEPDSIKKIFLLIFMLVLNILKFL